MKYIISEQQLNNLIDNTNDRIMVLVSALKDTVSDIDNNWNSKQRESFIFNKLLEVPFIKDGQFIISDLQVKRRLKEVFLSETPNSFTTQNLSEYFNDIDTNLIYIISEPFGSKASPDFLFITGNGVFGIEDKSSKNKKISFNTGTPGGNKFIMYYDRKDKTIYLLTGSRWGWNQDIERRFKEFTKTIIDYAAREFEVQFGEQLPNMTYYARPMLVDKNKVVDIVQRGEEDVIEYLRDLIN